MGGWSWKRRLAWSAALGLLIALAVTWGGHGIADALAVSTPVGTLLFGVLLAALLGLARADRVARSSRRRD
jgi:hypothetical protein